MQVDRQQGFTLLEMLIALGLAAVVGAAVLTTYSSTVSSTAWIRKTVAGREMQRLLPSILDADIAGLVRLTDAEGRSLVPPLSRSPMDRFHPPVQGDTPPDRAFDDTVLVAFATSTSLMRESSALLSSPVCVEYVLRSLSQDTALLRRERAFCGVRGDFPWEELILARRVREVELAALDPKEGYVTTWSSTGPLPQAMRFRLYGEGDEHPLLELLLPLPQQRMQVQRWR